MALSLKAVLGLDGSGFELGIKRAQSQASKFASEVRGGINSKLGGLLATTAIVAFAKKTIDAAGAVNDMSERLDISTDAVQQWNYAAAQAGSSAEKVTGFFEKLADARADALSGNAGKMDSFRALGVSESDLKSGRLEDIGLKIGNAVKTGDAQKLISSLKDVGGKGAASLVAAFKAGLEDAFSGAPIIKAEQIIALDALGDKMQTLALRLQVAFAPVIMFLANGLSTVLNEFEQEAAGVGAFFGALAGGATMRDARRAAYGASKERQEEQVKIAKALQDQIEDAKRRGTSSGGVSSASPKDSGPMKWSLADELSGASKSNNGAQAASLQMTNLQQIGARVAFNPLQSAIQQNTSALRMATAAFEKTTQRSSPYGGVSYDA